METKKCSRCKEVKPISEFTRNAFCKDGLHHYCRNCNREYSKKYTQTEKSKTYRKNYEAENRERKRPLRRKSYQKIVSSPEGKAKLSSYKSNRYSTEQNRNWARKRLYGVTPEQYEDLLKRQGGVCLICETPNTSEKPLSIDHCHKTGKIRGLLCHFCNRGLGNFKDSIDNLKKAIEYLEREN